VVAIVSQASCPPDQGFVLEDRNGERHSETRAPSAKKRLLWALTPSEREVALLACEGGTNQELAPRVRKSVLTIKKQLTSIFAILEVPSRARLISLLR